MAQFKHSISSTFSHQAAVTEIIILLFYTDVMLELLEACGVVTGGGIVVGVEVGNV